MATGVYTKCVYRQVTPNGVHRVFVPPLKLWILRCVDAYGSMDAVSFTGLLIGSIAEDVSIIRWDWLALDISARHWEGRQTITYSDGVGGIFIWNVGAHDLDVSITVYELEDPDAQPPIP